MKQKGIKFETFEQNDVQKGIIALIRKSLEILICSQNICKLLCSDG